MTPYHVGRALDVFEFYRHSLGFSQYRAMLPTLRAARAAAGGERGGGRRSPGAGALAGRPRPCCSLFAVLALGAGVAAFHAGAFFYFWMTLGLFPAVAFALALGPLRDALLPAGARPRALAAALLWAALAIPGAVKAVEPARRHAGRAAREPRLHPPQLRSRATPASIRSARSSAAPPAAPLPLYFSQTIFRDFVGPQAEANLAHMEQRFRARADQVPGAVVPAEPVPARAAALLGRELPAVPRLGVRRRPPPRGRARRDQRLRADRAGPLPLAAAGCAAARADRRDTARRRRRSWRSRPARTRPASSTTRPAGCWCSRSRIRRARRRCPSTRCTDAGRAAHEHPARLSRAGLPRAGRDAGLAAARLPVVGERVPANPGFDVEVVKGLSFERRIASRGRGARGAGRDHAPAVGTSRRAAALPARRRDQRRARLEDAARARALPSARRAARDLELSLEDQRHQRGAGAARGAPLAARQRRGRDRNGAPGARGAGGARAFRPRASSTRRMRTITMPSSRRARASSPRRCAGRSRRASAAGIGSRWSPEGWCR